MAGGAKWRFTFFKNNLLDGCAPDRIHIESAFLDVLVHKAQAVLKEVSDAAFAIMTWKELAVRQISPALPSGVALRGQLPGQTSMFEEAMAEMERDLHGHGQEGFEP